MKIVSWRIEGFGVFAGSQVTELGAGLTIVHGRNEAGKTTLVDFLCGVLFGFPDRRKRVNQHEPLAGGRHGGSVELLGADGTRLRVERYVGVREAVVTSNGEPRTLADLRRMLGGADEGLFRSTFAVGLDELRSLDTLEQDEVRELVYSAGVLGAGQRASAALRGLDERRARIVRARQADARANRLAQQLDDVENVLREARKRARHFPEMLAELDRRADIVARCSAELEDLTRRSRQLDRLLAAWPAWNRRRLACKELSLLNADAEAHGDAAALAAAPDVAALSAAFAAADAGREQRGSLDRSRRSLEESIVTELSLLGRGWQLARARSTDCSIGVSAAVHAHGTAIEASLAAVRTQNERLAIATDARQRAMGELDLHGGATRRSRMIEEIDLDRARVRSCRALLADEARQRAEARAETLAHRLESSGPAHTAARHPSNGLAIAAYAAVSALAAVAVLGLAWHSAAVSIAAVSLMACAALIALRRRARSQNAGAPARQHAPDRRSPARQQVSDRRSSQRRDAAGSGSPSAGSGAAGSGSPAAGSGSPSAADALAVIVSKLAELAAALDLGCPVISADLDGLESRLETERDHCRARQRAIVELAHATRSLEAEASTLRSRQAELARAQQAWSDWKDQAALTDLGTPDEADQVLDVVSKLRGHADALDRVESELARQQDQAQAVEAKASRLLTDLHVDSHDAVELRARVVLLSSRVEAARARNERARGLDDAIRGASLQLADLLGADPDLPPVASDADGANDGSASDAELAFHRDLASGDVSAWQEELITLQRRRAEVAAAHEAAVREHQDQARQLDAVAGSDHIARLELERTRLVAELQSEMTEWWVLSLARALIAATLETYERERQPAVVCRAAELFAEVTAGRYVRLVPRTAGSSGRTRSMDAIDRNGRSIDISCLSRGSVEQLYLCLRVALAEVFAAQSVALPFLMDDVLVNLDPERAQAMAGVLADLSAHHQVLFFTCHPHVVEMLARRTPGARLVELSSRTSAGSPLLAPPVRPLPLADRSRPVA